MAALQDAYTKQKPVIEFLNLEGKIFVKSDSHQEIPDGVNRNIISKINLCSELS